MKKRKKIVLGVLAGMAGFVIVAAILAVIFFPGNKMRMIIEENASNTLKMPVAIGSVRLSLLGVPGVEVKTITIGPARKSEPLLAAVKSIKVHISWLSLLRGQLEIKSLDVDTPIITLLKRQDKSSNLPAFADTTRPKTAGPPALPIPVTLKSFRISDGKLTLINEADTTQVGLGEISQRLSLRISRDMKNLRSSGKISIKNISYVPGSGKKPLSGISLIFSHELTGMLSSGDLSLSKGELELNGLPMMVTGKISGWKTISFHVEAKDIGADKITGALPPSLIGPRNEVSAKGSFSLTLDSRISALTPKPVFSYTGKMAIENMSISVKGFAKKIDRMQSFITFSEKEMVIKDTAVKTGASVINLSGTVSNYLEKPAIDLNSRGNIRIDDFSEALPAFKKSGLKGDITFDLSATGTPSLPRSMEMNGTLSLKGFSLPSSKVMKNPVLMNGSLRFSPKDVTLESLSVKTGKSDFSLNGQLSGYMNLLPSKEPQPAVLKGTLNSHLIDINDMIFIDKKTPILKPWDLEKPLKNLPIPPILQADASLSLQSVVFGRLKAESIKGRLTIKNGILDLNGLEVSAYDGKLTGNTSINFSQIENVRYNGEFDLKKLSAQTFISSFFGTGDNFRGLVSSSLSFSGAGLDSISFLNNLKGSGSGSIENGQFVNWDFTKKLGQKLQFLNFDTLSFGNAYTTFNFEKQRVFTPALLFQTQYGDFTISGSTGYDTTINYDIAFKLNNTAANLATKSKLGDIGSILSSGTVPQLYLIATGTLKSPSFQIDTTRTRKEVQDKVKNEAEKLLNKQDEKLREKGKKILDKLFR
jgi:uncharacterized protein involved in outer membrane biogenesis